MADELRVDLEALRHAGNQIAHHGETLHAVHQSCYGEVQDAHPGWIGSSAAALSELLEAWAVASTTQLQRVGGQSCSMQVAAAELMFMETRNVAMLSASHDPAPPQTR